MKKHNTLKVVLITIFVLTLLTWILPSAVYQGEFYDQGRIQMGLFDLLSYPTAAVSYFGSIAVFVLAIGGFYGVLSKTGVYRNLLEKIASKFKGKESLCLAVIMVLFAVVTSVSGLSVGLLVFFPFVISLILLMGYNKLVAASVTVGSVTVGLMGTTFSHKTLEMINQVLSLDLNSEIITKVIILVLGLILLIFNTLLYAKKVKGAVSEEKEELLPEKIETKRKAWPMIVILDVLFLVMLLSFISWSQAFNLDIFEKATDAVMKFKVFGFPIFEKILSTSVTAFGKWSITELISILVLATLLIAVIYRVKLNDMLGSFLKGAKKALGPAALMLLIYVCLVICTYHPFQLTIAKFLLGLTKGFNVVTTTVVALLSSIFNVEMLYTAQSTAPYLASVINDTALYPLIQIIYQTMYGFATLVAPTSIILMGTLTYMKVPYHEWLKHIWKLLLQLLVVLFIVFIIIMII